MPKLNFPDFDFKIKKDTGKLTIFDAIRKKYIVLTPEEWVRQHLVHYLMIRLHYSKGLIKLENTLRYNKMKKRADLVVYDQKGNPYLIAECKNPAEKIDQNTFDQISVYNQEMKAKFLVVTNGLTHYCCKMDYESGSFIFVDELPGFEEQKGST